MSEKLTARPQDAVNFLNWFLQGAPIHLVRMESSGDARPVSKTYLNNQRDDVHQFIATNNSDELRRNIYFVANSEFLDGDRKKANLRKVRYLQLDIDAKDFVSEGVTWDAALNQAFRPLLDQKVRPKGVPVPTAVSFTGGGYQAFWRMAEPISVEMAEDLNRALIEAFGGDGGTHDAIHLMRLPYSVNWLNQHKRDQGRTPGQSKIVHREEDGSLPKSYAATDLPLPRARAKAGVAANMSMREPSQQPIQALPLPDDLASILPEGNDWRMAIVDGVQPPGKNYPSRSERMFGAVIWMLAGGVQPGHVLSILLDPSLRIGDHVREHPPAMAYAQRQISQAMVYLAARQSDWPIVNKDGLPVSQDAKNIRFALAQLGLSAHHNEFTGADEVHGFGLDGRDINDIAEILASEFEIGLGFVASQMKIKQEIANIAHHARYHPVLEYLGALVWDGVPRLDLWLKTYCKAVDTDLHRAFGAKVFIGAVRRVKYPGCKFDTMLVLEGPQGTSKSSLVAAMAVSRDWFSESLDLRADDKTKAQILDRAWIVECPEMNGMSKVASQELKKFLSESVDTYRRPYDRTAKAHPRHCVIIGTTNDDQYLRDTTGNRRFWPVRVGRVDLDGFAADIDQLWAEAVQREAEGESLTLSEELWQAAEEVQKARLVEDPYYDDLRNNFEGGAGKVTLEAVKEILGLEPSRSSPNDSNRIKTIMAGMGWVAGTYRFQHSAFGAGRAMRGFRRAAGPDGAALADAEYTLRKHPDGHRYAAPAKEGHDPSQF